MAILLAIVGCIALPGITARQLSDADINKRAARAKAIALTDLSGTLYATQPWGALVAAEQARCLYPEDTTVRLVSNSLRLKSSKSSEKDFDEQLALITAKPDAHISYYADVIIQSSHYLDTDSLAPYRLARMACRNHPEADNIADFALNYALQHLGELYIDVNDSLLPMSPHDVEFARSLVAFADSVILQNGYNPSIDYYKAKTLFLLNDTTALAALADEMYRRDPDNPQVLTNLTNVYMSLRDTARVTEMGLRSFELEPAPNNVYGLYMALEKPDDRDRLTSAVFKTAANPDFETGLRIDLLDALVRAYYENAGLENENPDILPRIVEIADELVAEDPRNIGPAISLSILGRSSEWFHSYGYNYITDFALANPDSIEALSMVVPMLSRLAPSDPRVDRVFDYYHDHGKDHPLEADLAKATYLINNGKDEEALKILEAVTLSDTRGMIEKQIEDIKASADKDDDVDFDDKDLDVEKRVKEQWVLIKTIISESQERLGRRDDAIKTLQEIINYDPENATALNNLAYYMATNGGDLDLALTLANRSLELAAENPNTIDTRAWIYFLKGNYEEAYKDMELFFKTVKFPVEIILEGKSDPEEESLDPGFVDQIDSHNINRAAISPILGHLLKIFEKMGSEYERPALRVVRTLEILEPENTDLVEYLKSHPQLETNPTE